MAKLLELDGMSFDMLVSHVMCGDLDWMCPIDADELIFILDFGFDAGVEPTALVKAICACRPVPRPEPRPEPKPLPKPEPKPEPRPEPEPEPEPQPERCAVPLPPAANEA